MPEIVEGGRWRPETGANPWKAPYPCQDSEVLPPELSSPPNERRGLPRARVAGTMGGRLGGGWASARSGLEVDPAGALGAGAVGLVRGIGPRAEAS